jgi:hypothetical protein
MNIITKQIEHKEKIKKSLRKSPKLKDTFVNKSKISQTLRRSNPF